ncbi:MAG TPA: hypothetical protein VFY84_20550 [Jiangellales bacterium]|nr:hypothetical protein [Jiangellales bacterium]
MAQFKVRLLDGAERTVVAQRVVSSQDLLVFQTRGDDAWRVVDQVANEDVDVIQRRVVEYSGMTRWITERPPAATGV